MRCSGRADRGAENPDDVEIAIANQAREPAQGRHGNRAGDEIAGHDPLNGIEVCAKRGHDAGQGDNDRKHAK